MFVADALCLQKQEWAILECYDHICHRTVCRCYLVYRIGQEDHITANAWILHRIACDSLYWLELTLYHGKVFPSEKIPNHSNVITKYSWHIKLRTAWCSPLLLLHYVVAMFDRHLLLSVWICVIPFQSSRFCRYVFCFRQERPYRMWYQRGLFLCQIPWKNRDSVCF